MQLADGLAAAKYTTNEKMTFVYAVFERFSL